MLFSDPTIATFINQNFEPSWESVRPVPTINIDFGGGHVLRRTLHGNVASYVCDSDGNVIDVLPGVYDKTTYLAQLKSLLLAANFVCNQSDTAFSSDAPMKIRRWNHHRYHETRRLAVQSGQPLQMEWQEQGASIMRSEAGLKVVLHPLRRLQYRASMSHRDMDTSDSVDSVDSVDSDTASGPSETTRRDRHMVGKELLSRNLKTDAQINESKRRVKIHGYLLTSKNETPADMKKWLYREVLRADLDDPYLGLGKLLFDTYPFADEDGTTGLHTSIDSSVNR